MARFSRLSRLIHSQYQIIQPSQYNEAVSFYYEHFLPLNPVYSSLGLHEKRHPYLNRYVLNTLKANISWCAVESTSGEMIGLHLCSSINADNLPPADRTLEDFIAQGLPESLAHVQILRNKLFHPRELFEEFFIDKIMYFNGGATSPDYLNKGIATKLAEHCIGHGREHGYCLVAANSSSFYTQKICERMGFEKRSELKYSEYSVNGKIIFENIQAPHESVINYIKKI